MIGKVIGSVVLTVMLSSAAWADADALEDAGQDVGSDTPDAEPAETSDSVEVGLPPEEARDVVSRPDTAGDGGESEVGGDTRADGPRPYTLLVDDEGACTAGGRGRPAHPLFLLAVGLLLGRVLRRRPAGGRS